MFVLKTYVCMCGGAHFCIALLHSRLWLGRKKSIFNSFGQSLRFGGRCRAFIFPVESFFFPLSFAISYVSDQHTIMRTVTCKGMRCIVCRVQKST